MNKKVGLIILDGWGLGDQSNSDAIYNAHTPFFDRLMQNYPNATLQTSGEAVGLPDGQMGNSEVGHLNIGAGRIVYQELTRINKSIRDGELQANPVLNSAFEKAKESGRKLHFVGLVSDGGVHSSQTHLHALCKMAQSAGLSNYYVHAITDGRDCDPKSGLVFFVVFFLVSFFGSSTTSSFFSSTTCSTSGSSLVFFVDFFLVSFFGSSTTSSFFSSTTGVVS